MIKRILLKHDCGFEDRNHGLGRGSCPLKPKNHLLYLVRTSEMEAAVFFFGVVRFIDSDFGLNL